MQFRKLSAQMGLGSDLIDWYWDETPVDYGQLNIDPG